MASGQTHSQRQLLQRCAAADANWLWRGDLDFSDLCEPADTTSLGWKTSLGRGMISTEISGDLTMVWYSSAHKKQQPSWFNINSNQQNWPRSGRTKEPWAHLWGVMERVGGCMIPASWRLAMNKKRRGLPRSSYHMRTTLWMVLEGITAPWET